MRIAGNNEKIEVEMDGISVTDPYKLPNQNYYNISLKKDKKTLYRIIFSDTNEASRFKSLRGKKLSIIKLPIVSENGKTIDEAYFYTLKTMESFIKHMGKEDIKSIKERAEKVKDNQILTLEDLARANMGDDLPEFNDEEFDEIVKEFENEFEEKSENCKKIAKGLLVNIANYYLGEDFINENDYIKFKMQLEENSLSTLIFQIDVSKKAIHDISKKIYIGSSTTKDIEALATIQRIVLDVNKYQSALIKEIVEDFNRVKNRYKEINETKEIEKDDSIISTSDRKKLLEEIRKIKNSEVEDVDYVDENDENK